MTCDKCGRSRSYSSSGKSERSRFVRRSGILLVLVVGGSANRCKPIRQHPGRPRQGRPAKLPFRHFHGGWPPRVFLGELEKTVAQHWIGATAGQPAVAPIQCCATVFS